jgi:hypothetical protein
MVVLPTCGRVESRSPNPLDVSNFVQPSPWHGASMAAEIRLSHINETIDTLILLSIVRLMRGTGE